MIRQMVYVIRDEVSKGCSPLFIAPNNETAKRQFRHFLEGLNTSYEDYKLYELGEFFSENDVPTVASLTCPMLIYTGLQVEAENLEKLKDKQIINQAINEKCQEAYRGE